LIVLDIFFSEGCTIKVLHSYTAFAMGLNRCHDMWVPACGGDRDALTACPS
jgi:hypothetical protein